MKSNIKIAVMGVAALLLGSVASAQLLFTQYYEGTSNNKWVEITNVGADSIDLSLYSLSLLTNANAETWKTDSPTTTTVYALSGTLTAGSSLVLANSSAVLPYTPTTEMKNSVVNFNGNDSMVLWNDSTTYSTAQIVDALSFTNAGNEGVDKSFVRISTAVGYDLSAGSNITNYASVWSVIDLATANAATAGTDNYLGFSSLSSVPEPSTFAAFAGVAALAGAVMQRRRKSVAKAV